MWQVIRRAWWGSCRFRDVRSRELVGGQGWSRTIWPEINFLVPCVLFITEFLVWKGAYWSIDIWEPRGHVLALAGIVRNNGMGVGMNNMYYHHQHQCLIPKNIWMAIITISGNVCHVPVVASSRKAGTSYRSFLLPGVLRPVHAQLGVFSSFSIRDLCKKKFWISICNHFITTPCTKVVPGTSVIPVAKRLLS